MLSNPFVAGELGLQFCADIPLRRRDGFNLDTLCILDIQPRASSHRDLKTLEDLAAILMNDLEQRLQSRDPA
jgi:GAF domain-containing protein